jgi:hypothetical protein
MERVILRPQAVLVAVDEAGDDWASTSLAILSVAAAAVRWIPAFAGNTFVVRGIKANISRRLFGFCAYRAGVESRV